MQIGKDYIGVGCGAFIINDQNELLLQQRNKSPEKEYWSIPGGKVEMFETFDQAVKREVKEETGEVWPEDTDQTTILYQMKRYIGYHQHIYVRLQKENLPSWNQKNIQI